MFDRPTVVVRDVSKTYKLKRDGSERGFFSRRRAADVHALKSVSFATYAGQCVGILGRNGSGKSTLLSIIAGNDAPTSGLVRVSAQPTLLGVSAALQGHLSGISNIRLGLLAMGLNPTEVAQLIPKVLEWADLENAGDRPMATYSSGMRSRLKFAIATAVNREILLVDEALSTGDATFAEKAAGRMARFLENSGTVFIVSHGPGAIEKYCNRALWLHDGEIIADGKPALVAKSYKSWSRHYSAGRTEDASNIIDKRRSSYVPDLIVFDSEVTPLLDQP